REQGASGFGDMNVGTKSLLLDCELLQLAFQFKTFIPTGNFTRGLGTGHVSLEPALLGALKLTSNTYLQGEFAYWFPIAGDLDFQGPVFHWHLALNQMLWQCGCNKGIQLVGTAMLDGYNFLGGRFTIPVSDPTLFSQNASGSVKRVGTIRNVGP